LVCPTLCGEATTPFAWRRRYEAPSRTITPQWCRKRSKMARAHQLITQAGSGKARAPMDIAAVLPSGFHRAWSCARTALVRRRHWSGRRDSNAPVKLAIQQSGCGTAEPPILRENHRLTQHHASFHLRDITLGHTRSRGGRGGYSGDRVPSAETGRLVGRAERGPLAITPRYTYGVGVVDRPAANLSSASRNVWRDDAYPKHVARSKSKVQRFHVPTWTIGVPPPRRMSALPEVNMMYSVPRTGVSSGCNSRELVRLSQCSRAIPPGAHCSKGTCGPL
jgi:hypothetical protein